MEGSEMLAPRPISAFSVSLRTRPGSALRRVTFGGRFVLTNTPPTNSQHNQRSYGATYFLKKYVFIPRALATG